MVQRNKKVGVDTMELSQYYHIIRESKPKLKFCEWFDDRSTIWNFTRHSHPYIELMYFFEGKGKLEVSGTQMSISLFDAVVYPAGWEHQEDLVSERRREIICLWIDLPGLKLDAPMHLHDMDNTLNHVFRMLYQEAKRANPEPLLLEHQMKLLLTMLLRNQSEAKAREGTLAYVLQYIHTHFAEHITLDELAALEHISKSYLSRQFKQQTGMTVVAYINQLRIETAKRLLTGSDMSVNEIAYQIGFESPKYFYRTFKKLTDESPASFRRQYKNKQEPLAVIHK